ncbi:hypothetical protein M409DRAFT_61667 [Zasmidium cellare ATCC 36951]|uniref:Uncharacterized protein n=1 Tax=Zasmidium cellare ATCC 36951 TaxID=1080233 RepID=A0A6A6BUD2_ZASCE|nr:uncharacterized protein M409DRAFT_61667 [Zasmidium cellare ATCC 36951]KAF2158417.1 hypothetical protein M409DRAFT_61667 [Zasmidium cellare ATCC 36951]
MGGGDDESPTMGATRPPHRHLPNLSASTPSLHTPPAMMRTSSSSAHSTPSPVRAFYLHRNASSSTSTLGFRGSLPTLGRADSREVMFGLESHFASSVSAEPWTSRHAIESPTGAKGKGRGFFDGRDGEVSD